MKNEKPEKQLAGFLAKYTPEIRRLAENALATMRRRFPGAVEMVYDNYNALVIGFGPTDRASEAIFSIVLYPRQVNLCFLQGAKLRDPEKRLRGTGKQVRNIILEDAATLDEPGVTALIARTLASAKPLDATSPGRLVIKSISAKQRPRRPAKGSAKR